jgi:putative acetyltransferase
MLQLIRTNSENIDFKDLVTWLDKDLWERYGQAQGNYQQYNVIENNNTVLVAYFDGKPAGCGAFKRFNDSHAELKRLYVKPEFRGQGIGRTILHELENWAREYRYTVAILETGNKQSEANDLYKSTNYKIIENFGPYRGLSMSICFGKDLL